MRTEPFRPHRFDSPACTGCSPPPLCVFNQHTCIGLPNGSQKKNHDELNAHNASEPQQLAARKPAVPGLLRGSWLRKSNGAHF